MARLLAVSLGHVDRIELRLCRYLNRSSQLGAIRRFFSVVSRLGDGYFWYALVGVQVWINGWQGIVPAAHILLTAGVGVAVYKVIKAYAVRERPFVSDSGIRCACTPLDKYSFPSGHTLHAVSFSLMLAHYVPELAPLCLGFTVLVGLSRVILGLHYPTDVAAGAVLGGTLATVSLWLADAVLA
jgi:undecaprenyl-diphosphatase